MKNLTNKSIKKAIVATVAMAGLIAGTTACGGSNTTSAEAEKQALVELLLDAARNGASEGDIAEIIAEADPNLVAQVLPEVTDELDVVVPDVGVDTSAASDASTKDVVDGLGATEEAPAEDAAPVEEAPVEEAPAEEAAPIEEAPVEEAPVEEAPVEETPAEDDAPVVSPVEEDDGFVIDTGVLGLLNPGPSITIVKFYSGFGYSVSIHVDEGTILPMGDITSVKVTFWNSLGEKEVRSATLTESTSTSKSVWLVEGMLIESGDSVYISVKSVSGKTTSSTRVVSPIVPI